MIIVRPRYIVNEYSWEAKGPHRPSNLTGTILTVSFDHGAQRLFSSVRINVTHNRNVSTETIVGEWKFTPCQVITSIPPSIIDISRVSSVPLETECIRPNPSSLPVLNINFEIESIVFVPEVWDVKLNSRKIGSPSPRGALTFKNSRDKPHQTLLEVNQPLTADTQSVSASFTCSPLLYTPGQSGSGLPLDDSSTVGRVVHIRPAILSSEYGTILLPTEVLLMIFRNFSESSDVYGRWRRDLLSCALVCKQWTCALDLDLLLSDFHYPGARARQNGYPPEISSFANALASCPSLAVSITYLSPDYFLEHALWKTFRDSLTPSPFQLRPRVARAVVLRIEQFLASFLSILRLARNLRSLSLSSRWNIGLPDDFLDALRGLDRIEEVDVTGEFNTVHQAYLASWSSLKRLKMVILQPKRDEPVPATPPRYALTDATLLSTVRDEYLNYVLSASSSSLERLEIRALLWTNAGLRSALRGVSKCLVSLRIGPGGSGPGKDEEHALDSLMVQMACLEHLAITPTIATHLMIERRSEAFKQSCASGSPTTLPVINLLIDLSTVPLYPRKNDLLTAASQVWPGWAIDTYEPPK